MCFICDFAYFETVFAYFESEAEVIFFLPFYVQKFNFNDLIEELRQKDVEKNRYSSLTCQNYVSMLSRSVP